MTDEQTLNINKKKALLEFLCWLLGIFAFISSTVTMLFILFRTVKVLDVAPDPIIICGILFISLAVGRIVERQYHSWHTISRDHMELKRQIQEYKNRRRELEQASDDPRSSSAF